jgi:hypothetical protein
MPILPGVLPGVLPGGGQSSASSAGPSRHRHQTALDRQFDDYLRLRGGFHSCRFFSLLATDTREGV